VNRTPDGRWTAVQSANPATQFQKGNTAARGSNRHTLLSRAYGDQL
jgi:hypothetical protein